MTTANYKPKRSYTQRMYMPHVVLDERDGPLGFANRLNRLRHGRRMAVTVLARHLRVSSTIIHNWERGDRFPTYWNLLQVASFFNVSLDWLTGHEVKENEQATPHVAPDVPHDREATC